MKREYLRKKSCKSTVQTLPASLLALCLLGVIFLLPLSLWGRAAPPATMEPTPSSGPPAGADVTLRVLMPDGTVEPMPLEDYVWGALAAEMPAAFHSEALKAQSVAARTYALKLRGEGARHPGADLCTDSACCVAWTTRDAARARWGADGDFYTQKLDAAVAATAGEALTYDGALIDAVFHSSSDGRTADAQSVWGRATPYLVSVATPETGADVPNFQSELTLTPQEFQAKFREQYPDARFPDDPAEWFTELTRADWGGVQSVTVAGVPVTGGELRSLLGLRSARFTVEADKKAVTFSVTAYGHGVGMSQYGANVLARSGSDYQEILARYYPGAELTLWEAQA